MAFSNEKKGLGEAALEKFTEMLIQRMEQLQADKGEWQKGWLPPGHANGVPQNISGRPYSGANPFFLQLESALKGYTMPVFLTFKQAMEMDAHVLKGEKGTPILYFDLLFKDEAGKTVSRDKVNNMTQEEKDQLKVIPLMKGHYVFNIDQTNIKEVKPDLYADLLKKFEVKEFKDTEGMYTHKALDSLVANGAWVCPIKTVVGDRAFFSPTDDVIVLPQKGQFKRGDTPEAVYESGMEYYSTMLHEMTHSTGTAERLNRLNAGKFADKEYAKEELVAELSAAFLSSSMGMTGTVSDNSACYLNAWSKVLKEEPKFLLSVMKDVNAASNMIMEKVNAQQLEIDKKEAKELTPFDNFSVMKKSDGNYGIRASLDGMALPLKAISNQAANDFISADMADKHAVGNRICATVYADRLAERTVERDKSLRI